MLFKFWLIVNYTFVNFVMVLIEMWRETDNQLIQKGTYTIDISPSIMALTHQDFWAHVFRRATERMRSLTVRDYLRKSEISNLQVSINVNKNVLWFDIPVDNIHVVQMLQSEQKLRKVELGLILREPLNFTKVEEHLSTSAQVHYEKQLSFGLK